MFYERWLSWVGNWGIALNAVLDCEQLPIFLPRADNQAAARDGKSVKNSTDAYFSKKK